MLEFSMRSISGLLYPSGTKILFMGVSGLKLEDIFFVSLPDSFPSAITTVSEVIKQRRVLKWAV